MKQNMRVSPLKIALKTFNVLAAVIHITSVIVVVTFLSLDSFPLPFKLTIRTYTDIPPGLLDSTCRNTTYAAQDYRDWFDCIKTLNITQMPKKELTTTTDIHSGIAVFIIVFIAITAMFHIKALFSFEQYYANLQSQQPRQPLRWIEYSITYTIMTLILFQLNEINGIYETILLVVSAFSQMIIGLAIEEIRFGATSTANALKIRQQRDITMYGSRRITKEHSKSIPTQIYQFVSSTKQNILGTNTTLILLFVAAWAIMASHFFIIFHSFIHAFHDFIYSDAGSLWYKLYEFIVILNIVILILYTGFPIVHTCVFFQREVTNAYAKGELAYVILSALSKTALIVIVTIGAQRQP